MYTYLLINLLSVAVPLVFSFHKRLQFYKTWPALWPAVFISGALFVGWDVLFTSRGVWGFNSRYLLGINWLGLPVEEWLFFICIPYACVFTYASIKKLISKDWLARYAKRITIILTLMLITMAFVFGDREYTSITFLLTGLFLFSHLLIFKSDYLGYFYLTYIIIFSTMFLLVNGILTGSFIKEEVVWYNNAENLGIRIFTIPIEDFVYGLLLILMTVTIYEKLLTKRRQAH